MAQDEERPFLLNPTELYEAFCLLRPAEDFVYGRRAIVAMSIAQLVVLVLLYPWIVRTWRNQHTEEACTCRACSPRESLRRLPRRRRAVSKERKKQKKKKPCVMMCRIRRKREKGSALLSLPLELRQEIVKLILGNRVLHIFTDIGREEDSWDNLGHAVCASAADTPHHWGDIATASLITRPAQMRSCIALLQTCRQIYREGIFLMYASNLFDFNRPMEYLVFVNCIRPQRLRQIRHLQITQEDSENQYELPPGEDAVRSMPAGIELWEKMWTVVGREMRALTTLKIRFYYREGWPYYSGGTPRKYVEDMLRPVRRRVRGLMEFSVEANELDFDLAVLEREVRRDVYGARVDQE